MKNIALIALGALLICIIGDASGPDDLDIQKSNYCDMHRIFQESNGAYGWPDFKGSYSEQCNGK